MLTVSHVTKTYGNNIANNDVSFTLNDNQITVLVGQNGAGKSTIIKCIVGFLNYHGEITLDGKDIQELDVKRQIGYIPEVPELYNELTVYQHFQFIANAYHITGFEERANHYLDLFKLTPKKDELCGSLSKGMRQKVSIICALIINPRLLIVDEPMVGLDPDAIRDLKQVFETLKAECSIFISTHLLDSVENLWDQALIMNAGKIVFSTLRENFDSTTQRLEDIYFSHRDPSDIQEDEANETI